MTGQIVVRTRLSGSVWFDAPVTAEASAANQIASAVAGALLKLSKELPGGVEPVSVSVAIPRELRRLK